MTVVENGAGQELVPAAQAARTVADVILADDFKAKVEQALPPGVTVDRFIRTTLTAIQRNPDVATEKRQSSLFLAVVQCAQDGLLPDGREAAFVTFGDTTAYMPMIGGLRKVAAKHGIALTAYVVYEKDTFSYALGFHPEVVHSPPLPLGSPRGEAIGAYAVATDGLGQRYVEVMAVADIEKIRNVSRARNNGPWKDHWGEMARKTVARRLFKQLALADLDDISSRVVLAADVDVDFTPDPVTALLNGATVPADDDKPDDNLVAEIPPANEPPMEQTFDQKGKIVLLVKEVAGLRKVTQAKVKEALANDGYDTKTLSAFQADEVIGKLERWRDRMVATA